MIAHKGTWHLSLVLKYQGPGEVTFFSSQAKILLSLSTQEYEQVLANCLENLMKC